MAKANAANSIPPATCERSLRLRLRKAGMRLEQCGSGYRIMSDNQVLLQRGADGCGLSLVEIMMLTSAALDRRAHRWA